MPAVHVLAAQRRSQQRRLHGRIHATDEERRVAPAFDAEDRATMMCLMQWRSRGAYAIEGRTHRWWEKQPWRRVVVIET
jgi:hypothetical protein